MSSRPILSPVQRQTLSQPRTDVVGQTIRWLGYDGLGRLSSNTSRPYLSSARGLGKPSKNVEDQWLAIEIECFNIARRLVELLPDGGNAVEGRSFCSGFEAPRQPSVHRVDEGCKRSRIGAVETVAEAVQG